MIVVFGAAGFIGTYLIDQLIADGHHVAGSDISDVANAHFSVRKVPFHRIDITQQQQFDKLPAQAVDAVVHLACVQPANVSEQQYNPLDYVRVNVIGTLNILEYCRVNSIPKIIYTCSHRNTQGMWAAKAGSPIGEKDGRSIKFTGDYAMFSISESAATDCIEHYAQTYGIEGVTFRYWPAHLHGPPPRGSTGARQIRRGSGKRHPRDSPDQVRKIPLRARLGLDARGSSGVCESASTSEEKCQSSLPISDTSMSAHTYAHPK